MSGFRVAGERMRWVGVDGNGSGDLVVIGRATRGGVKVVKGPDAAEKAATDMVGMRLVTYQTGPDGQVVGRLVYERMAALPERLYGADLKSNYQGQGLKLAKQFR